MNSGNTERKGRAARELSQLLALARWRTLPIARKCLGCRKVFTPVLTTDQRCADCALAVAEAEAVLV